MDQLGGRRSKNAPRPRRAFAGVSMVLVLVIFELLLIGAVVSVSRDHDLTIWRLQTVQAEYAAEAGVNMSVREMIKFTDEDGDGTVGSISDDGDSNNDPILGNARVLVTMSPDDPAVGQTTMTSVGRSGQSRRKMTTILE